MQKAYEDQLLNSADRVLFTSIKLKQCIRSARMLHAVAASKDAFSF